MTEPVTDCKACVFYRSQPMDCLIVPNEGVRHRSLMIIGRIWSAEKEPCEEVTPIPSADDRTWAAAVAENYPPSQWARMVSDAHLMSLAKSPAQVLRIMEASIAERRGVG